MREIVLDREQMVQQDGLWLDAYQGQFPDGPYGQSPMHGQFPPNLERSAVESYAAPAAVSADEANRAVQYGRSLGNYALNGGEYVMQGAGNFTEDFFTAFVGAEVPPHRARPYVGQYALAA